MLSAVFAVEQIAHGPSAGCVDFRLSLTLDRVHGTLGGGLLRLGGTTGWAAIGESGLIWP